MNREAWVQRFIDLVEAGHMPDCLTRFGIRRLLASRLRTPSAEDCEENQRAFEQFLAESRQAPVAPAPREANEQHYEVPPEFFAQMLGPRRKYSSCWYPHGVSTLAEAEEAALAATAEHAELADGQRILELGCGWGSLSLWMAEHYPNAHITAVSNSASQRAYILERAAERGFRNLEVITADMNEFETSDVFDRAVSVEMFEHMRNHAELLRRIAGWLRPGGKLLVHVFCHRTLAYPFGDEGAVNWMGRYFFTGGVMPSDQLLLRCQDHLRVREQWRWNGRHYARTADAWIANLDRRRSAVLPILARTYGQAEAERWFHRWRLLMLAGSELFGYEGGRQWWVSHYQFENPVVPRPMSRKESEPLTANMH